MLEVSSTEIIFDLKNDVYIPYNISLKNVTSLYIAYKNFFLSNKVEDQFHHINLKLLSSAQQIEQKKNQDPKHIVNQKFQIYAISIQEKKSTAEIDNLFQSQACFNIRLCTSVLKEEFGKKIPIYGNNLASSHTSILSNSRTESQPILQSMIQPNPLNNQVQCVQRLKQIELDLAEEKRKREQIYNTIEISKLKKGSSLFKFILPIILGIVLSNFYQLSLQYYE
ncbi:unnamed protein product [Paramecium pentaurelia]|uniref:Transmembrane protein n=1 Tax=Paramecium pentaurelia TaxID=43138 RepID=A0A8S1UCA0_9CILI|nr:unnamed protein product [Paramecium pentaurelia]